MLRLFCLFCLLSCFLLSVLTPAHAQAPQPQSEATQAARLAEATRLAKAAQAAREARADKDAEAERRKSAAKVAEMMQAAQAPPPVRPKPAKLSVKSPAKTLATKHLQTGQELYRKGRVTEAIAQFRNAVLRDPQNPQAHFLLASALDDSGNPTAAVQEYRIALRLKPDYAAASLSLGTSLYLAGSRTEARTQWHKAAALGNSSEKQDALRLLKAYP